MNASDPNSWISARSRSFDSSGIRKVFDLAAKLKDPINLSIGQPDFDVPDAAKQACIAAIQEGKKRLFANARDQAATRTLESGSR